MPFLENRDFKELLIDIDITEDYVFKKLKKTQNLIYPLAQTPCIHPRVIHEIAESVAVPRSYIFKTSLAIRTLPNEWKHANITAIFKQDRRWNADKPSANLDP